MSRWLAIAQCRPFNKHVVIDLFHTGTLEDLCLYMYVVLKDLAYFEAKSWQSRYQFLGEF